MNGADALAITQDAHTAVQHAPPPLGSLPLRNGRHERFAKLVAGLVPKAKAYAEAFDYDQEDPKEYHAARGNGARLERRKEVAARIAWLSRQQEEIIAQKRERLERWLWTVMEHNPADLWEVAERPLLDGKGNPVINEETDEFVMVKYQRARFLGDLPPEALTAVEGLQMTESGKVVTKTYSKMQANKELRALLGIGTATAQIGDDIGSMSTTQIVAELNALGVEVKIGVQVTR